MLRGMPVQLQPSAHTSIGTLVTLSDGAGSRVVLAPARGAIVRSFEVEGRELLYLEEETFVDPLKNVRGGVPILFPSPGRLDGDRWQHAGRSGSMAQHGFARTLPWSIAATGDTSVTLALESSPLTRPQYPWEFRAELEVLLAPRRLRLTFRVHNHDVGELPFALGYHPYFRVIDKRRIALDTHATRAFDNRLKRVVPFRGFDFLSEELDLHLLDHGADACSLSLGDGARAIVRASPEFSWWVVWTLAGRDFVCVEPWTAPGNALNSGERLSRVAPGTTCESWIEIELAH